MGLSLIIIAIWYIISIAICSWIEYSIAGTLYGPWIGLFLLVFISVFIAVKLGWDAIKNWGSNYLTYDLAYLGLRIQRQDATTNHGYPITYSAFIPAHRAVEKPLNRAVAWLAYMGSIVDWFRKNGEEYKVMYDYISPKPINGTIDPYSYRYWNLRLRREVWRAIQAEQKLHKTKTLSFWQSILIGNQRTQATLSPTYAAFLFAFRFNDTEEQIQQKATLFTERSWDLPLAYEFGNEPEESLELLSLVPSEWRTVLQD